MRKYDFAQSFGSAGPFEEVEDADPRVGLVNLADVMLVFACGLMLALVSFWNLDVSNLSEVIQSESMVQIEDPAQMEDASGGGGYVDMGRVYMDPDSGKMYMETDSDTGASSTGEDNADGINTADNAQNTTSVDTGGGG